MSDDWDSSGIIKEINDASAGLLAFQLTQSPMFSLMTNPVIESAPPALEWKIYDHHKGKPPHNGCVLEERVEVKVEMLQKFMKPKTSPPSLLAQTDSPVVIEADTYYEEEWEMSSGLIKFDYEVVYKPQIDVYSIRFYSVTDTKTSNPQRRGQQMDIAKNVYMVHFIKILERALFEFISKAWGLTPFTAKTVAKTLTPAIYDRVSKAEVVPWLPQYQASGYQSSASALAQLLPGVLEFIKHPVSGGRMRLQEAIINLNDSHKWTREQIADWVETLDVNITFKGDTDDNTDN